MKKIITMITICAITGTIITTPISIAKAATVNGIQSCSQNNSYSTQSCTTTNNNNCTIANKSNCVIIKKNNCNTVNKSTCKKAKKINAVKNNKAANCTKQIKTIVLNKNCNNN